MEEASPAGRLRLVSWELPRGGSTSILHAGLDLSRRRLDFHLLDEGGETVEVGTAPPTLTGCAVLPIDSAAIGSRSGRGSSR
jgi:hypothetical protein